VSKDEALATAPFNCRINATAAYKKWKESQTSITEDSVREFMKEYLKTKRYNCAGDGAYIVTQGAIADSRNRPYQEVKAEYETRTHTPDKYYILRNVETKEEVGKFKTSKEAIAAAKKYVTDNHVSVKIFNEWVPKENNALYTTIKYVPSKNTRTFQAIAFGFIGVD
jgi:hypothetical protein